MEDLDFYLEQYNLNRPAAVDQNTFRQLSLLFPVIYVLTADGHFDWLERQFVQQLESQMHTHDYLYLELLHIAQHHRLYYPIFTAALRLIIAEGNWSVEHTFQWMRQAAQCSYDDWRNNLIYAQYPVWASLPVKLIAGFLEGSPKKASVSEAEKQAMLEILTALGGDVEAYAKQLSLL